jgi:CheY-like chemotaxis protein
MKILVVDDAKLMHSVLENYIKKNFSDVEIILASNGEEAVEKCKNEKPDMILTDIMMPGIDGIEAIKRIRKFDSKVNIIAISADGKFEKDSLAAGAKLFLKKPLSSEIVINAIKSFTNQNVPK